MVALRLTAEGMAFDRDEISVLAGSPVEMTFENRDAGIPHNFALYRDASATETLFKGRVIDGPGTVIYSFTAPPLPMAACTSVILPSRMLTVTWMRSL